MITKKISFVIITIFVMVFAVSFAETSKGTDNNYMDVSPSEALELINQSSNLLIIDVSPLWHKGHLPNAINFPWGNGSFEAAVPSWDPNAMYLIYCHGDAPSIAAAQHLADEGFSNVYRLEGNYGAWIDAGYEIEMGP